MNLRNVWGTKDTYIQGRFWNVNANEQIAFHNLVFRVKN